MARPEHVAISSGLAGWDGEVDDNFDLIFVTPVPISLYDDFGDLPTASLYDNCLAIIEDENVLCISNGSTWVRQNVSPPAYANFAALPAAADHLDEIAVIQDLDLLCISDGSDWKIIGTQASDIVAFTGTPGGSATDTSTINSVQDRVPPTVGALGNHADTTIPTTRTGGPGGSAGNFVTVTDPADTPATADALRDDLVANSLAELRDNQTTLVTFMTETITMLEIVQDSIVIAAEQMKDITESGGFREDVVNNLQAMKTKLNLIRTNLRATGLMA